MPAMDFPSSPTNGQVFGAYTYDSTKGAWRVTGVQATSVISSATPPSDPLAGNLWLNTNDGVLFVYYTDADTSQWVEVKSNTASGSTVAARVDTLESKPSGLVNVIPTSLAVGSGSATANSLGKVTFTNVSSVSLNNVFTSDYTNYRVITNYTNFSANNDLYFRLRASNVDSSTAYYYAGSAMNTAATSGSWTANNQIFFHLASNAAGYWNRVRNLIEIGDPAVSTTNTKAHWTSFHDNGSTWSHTNVSGAHLIQQVYESMTLAVSAGTMSGSIQVYGYR